MPRAPDQSVISELFFVINLIGVSSAQMGTRNTNQMDSLKYPNYHNTFVERYKYNFNYTSNCLFIWRSVICSGVIRGHCLEISRWKQRAYEGFLNCTIRGVLFMTYESAN